MRSLIYPLILLLPLSAFAKQPAAQSQVHEYMLDNGLKLLVKEDHRAPVVVSQVWYKVGSSYEHDGITGISHVLEHMMFKGTDKVKPGEFSKLIKEQGGRDNAFTGRDYTAYFQILEKSRLPISLELEADRMRNLTLPPEEFIKEVEVVKEERRMRTEDDPRALTYEQFNAVAYTNNPYKHPIIGWMNDLDNLNVDDLRKWYAHWYAPNNATIVIAGDVEPHTVYEQVKKYFGQIPKSDVPTLKPRIEADQIGPRRVTVRAPAQVPYIMLGYKVPVLRTAKEEWEPYALEMLASVLSASRSSRFSKVLVREKQIATDADSGYSMDSLHNEMLLVDATPAPGKSVAEVEQALREQLDRLKTEKVSEEELTRIKAQVIANDVYQKDSVFYQAMSIGMLETVGVGWQKADEYLDKIRAVTAEQVQQVAKKYLLDDSLVVAVLEPQSDAKRPQHNPAITIPPGH
jgi:zinc protease